MVSEVGYKVAILKSGLEKRESLFLAKTGFIRATFVLLLSRRAAGFERLL